MRREESDSASYVCFNHHESDPPRHANASAAPDATLHVFQPSNTPSNPVAPDSVLSALLHQIYQLTAVLASQKTNRAADSRSLASISNRFCRRERSRVDRGNRGTTEPQSLAPAAPQLSTVVVDNRESRRNRSLTPPEDAVLYLMKYCGLLPMPSANCSRKSDWDRRDASRPFLLPLDRHAGFAATVLPSPHAAFASLPLPPSPQLLPFHSSVPPSMTLLPFVHESYLSLAPRLCRSRARCRRCCRLLHSRIRMPLLESPGMLRIETHCMKASSRQLFTKVSGNIIRAFIAYAELFLTFGSCPRDR